MPIKTASSESLVDLFSKEVFYSRLIKLMQKQPFRAFYFGLFSKKKRQAFKQRANYQQKKYVADCWNIFIQRYLAHELEALQILPKKNLSDQKIIWQYWGQGVNAADQPEMVKLCFKSVDKYKGDYQVIRLDEQNIRDYLELPEFVLDKLKNPQFEYAFFADLIRLALLDNYGGVWLDATILLTAPIPQEITDLDFFMFQRDEQAENKAYWEKINFDYFGWNPEHRVNVLNSFIVAKQGHAVIHSCLELLLHFWYTQNHIPHYFFFQILFNELMNTSLAAHNSPIMDDTLPHLLQRKIAEPFNPQDYELILDKISIHKMFYPKNCVPNSYYQYIRDQFLPNTSGTT